MAYLQIPMMGGMESWDDVLIGPRVTEDLTAAVAYFRSMLGENWVGWRNGVPLAAQFSVSIQSDIPEGVRLHRMIESLAGTAPGTLGSQLARQGNVVWIHVGRDVPRILLAVSRLRT